MRKLPKIILATVITLTAVGAVASQASAGTFAKKAPTAQGIRW